ncbi:MAG: hypothetical protein L6420_05860 [Elusimicrobia bacterium]|nr:hypothetical protein [Elusimicrobiota bacterium]
MKKVYLAAVIVFGFMATVKAGDMEVLKGADFGNLSLDKMADMEVLPDKVSKSVNKEADRKLVGQDIVYKFTKVGNNLRKLRNNVTLLDNDIEKLEEDAKKIARSGMPDICFEYNLREMYNYINDYYDDIARIHTDVRNLLKIAVKSDELNKIAKGMEADVIYFHNDLQFRLEDATRKLEWAVYSAEPEIIGHNVQWMASNITGDVIEYSSRVRNIYYGVQDLVIKTQPTLTKSGLTTYGPIIGGIASAANNCINAWNEYYSSPPYPENSEYVDSNENNISNYHGDISHNALHTITNNTQRNGMNESYFDELSND